MNYLFLQAAPAAPEAAGPLAMVLQFAPFILIFVAMYFFMIRPQKKKEKQIQEMRSKLEVGDEIITAGGIIGRIVSIRDDSVVLETGSDRSKVRIARWAIQANNTVHESTPEVK